MQEPAAFQATTKRLHELNAKAASLKVQHAYPHSLPTTACVCWLCTALTHEWQLIYMVKYAGVPRRHGPKVRHCRCFHPRKEKMPAYLLHAWCGCLTTVCHSRTHHNRRQDNRVAARGIDKQPSSSKLWMSAGDVFLRMPANDVSPSLSLACSAQHRNTLLESTCSSVVPPTQHVHAHNSTHTHTH
jgi:hypothetical protein